MALIDSACRAAGPSRKGHYYTPAARIELAPGVECRKLDPWYDIYSGTAEALERSGLLRADMLPMPGSQSIAWRPRGASKISGESWIYVPGYLEIRRHHTGTFRAHLTVSREEQAARRAAEEEREERQHEQEDRSRPAQADYIAAFTSDEFRSTVLTAVKAVRQIAVDGEGRRYLTVDFSESTRARIAFALNELEACIQGAQIVSRRHPSGGKGPLRLAWSAPDR